MTNLDCLNCGKPISQAYAPLDGYYWVHQNTNSTECLVGTTKAEPREK